MLDAMQALDVEAACRAVLFGLGQALLVGSILAALTWALVRLFAKRISPAMEVALWCIVLLRFVIPGGPDWSGSLASLCTMVVPAPPHAPAEREALPPTQQPDVGSTDPVNAVAARPGLAPWPGWATLTVIAYCAGLVGLAALRTASYRRFRATYAALPETDAGTRGVVRDICDRMGVRRMPGVRISDDHRAPFVMGVLRPLLVLSRHHLVRPEDLETVLVHEITHLRRCDMLVRCLQCVAGLLFFFWPIVAWVNRGIDRARECACDEWALRRGKLSAGQYARCLFEAARWRHLCRGAYAPACMAGHPSTIEKRIDLILTLPNRAPRGVAARLAAGGFLVAWCSFSLAGARPPSDDGKLKYAATSAGMMEHARVLYGQVKQLPGGDVDGNDEVTKEECWAYVTAVVLSQPAEILKAYPWADQNRNQRLEPDEAFFFSCGNYDLEDLQAKFSQDLKRAVDSGDAEKETELKNKLMTAEFATWHVILDRRAQLIAQAKTLPTPEFVRRVFENEMQVAIANGQFEQCVWGVKEVARLKNEAIKLRAKAAESTADKTALEAKAAAVEKEAADITSKLLTEINSRLAAPEGRGADETARYRGLLEKLKSL
jgi:beta-lactamase regulating signal transducer with metallopeptidase domain